MYGVHDKYMRAKMRYLKYLISVLILADTGT